MTMTAERSSDIAGGRMAGARWWAPTWRPGDGADAPPRVLSEMSGSLLLASVCIGIAFGATALGTRHLQLPALRVMAVVVVSFVPGWLYVRFSTYRAEAVWEEYVLYLHRLRFDDLENLPEPLASSSYHQGWAASRDGKRTERKPSIYEQKFEAFYGKGTARSRGSRPESLRARADSLFPVVLATVIVGVGWTAVLLGPSLPVDRFTTAGALRFGFMGAYSFVLQMLVRRFFQNDLRPSAYISVAVRVVTVCILVVVVFQATRPVGLGPGAATMFLIGFFPLLGMQALQRTAARVLRSTVRSLDTSYPLSDLDGLNVWNEARLLEVGVEDMQNLVTTNLVDVMLHTRIPMGRIVDWIDQAHLYLHLEPCRCRESADEDAAAGPPPPCSRTILRRYGIRTATDLEDVFRRTEPGSEADDGLGPVRLNGMHDNALVEALRWVLDGGDRSRPSATQAILKTFEGEPNLDHVRHWKGSWRPGHEQSRSPGGSSPAVAAA